MPDNKRRQELADMFSAREKGKDAGVVFKLGGKRKAGTATTGPIILRDGNALTKDMFDTAAKNGMPFADMQSMADWMNGWVKPAKNGFQPAPYYRVYGSDHNIPGSDILMLAHKYENDPNVQRMIRRSVAADDEVPQYGAEDADQLKALIKQAYADPSFKLTGQL